MRCTKNDRMRHHLCVVKLTGHGLKRKERIQKKGKWSMQFYGKWNAIWVLHPKKDQNIAIFMRLDHSSQLKSIMSECSIILLWLGLHYHKQTTQFTVKG